MILELIAGTAVGWLWARLEKLAESTDKKKLIHAALKESIKESFGIFIDKYPDFCESFFTKEFLEQHVYNEVLKYLTLNEKPNVELVITAFPDYVVLSSDEQHREEIVDFFNIVENCMKHHAVLEEIVNRRQIDETNQGVKELLEVNKEKNKLLDNIYQQVSYQQEFEERTTQKILRQQKDDSVLLVEVYNILADRLPDSRGGELNKFITKQLDIARDYITSGDIDSAQSLLNSMVDEVSNLDDYTRFRWHTNLAACLMYKDNDKGAAEEYLTAYEFAKNDEKAVGNKIRALLLLKRHQDALSQSEKAISIFPNSSLIWALHLKAKSLLNIEFEMDVIPDGINDDVFVLLTLSELKFQNSKYEESFDLAMSAYNKDIENSESKRAMLVSILHWINSDPVKAHYKQLNSKQKKALSITVNSFGDLIGYLRKIQSKKIFCEVAANLIIALQVMGKEQLKKDVFSYAYSTYPNEDIFLRHKIEQLEVKGRIDEIRALTENKLDSLSKTSLFIMAEISANNGIIEWTKKLHRYLVNKGLDKNELREIFGLEICSVWKSGDRKKAIKYARSNLQEIVSHLPSLVFYTRLLDHYNEYEERDKYIKLFTHLSDNSSSHNILLAADALYDFGLYFEASMLYRRLIVLPSDDDLTKRYIDSLIKSDQRALALSTFDLLSVEVRMLSVFKRLEANLARATGNLDTLERILSEELTDYPCDSYIAAGYVATLYHEEKYELIKKYLSDDPVYTPLIEKNEVEIAKFQLELGFEEFALKRIYKAFRKNTASSYLAGHFHLLMLHVKDTKFLSTKGIVSTDTYITLENDNHKKSIVIEAKERFEEGGWPECISEESQIASSLLGKKIGDYVLIDSLVPKKWKIENIESIYIFILTITKKVISDSASSTGPLWSINIKKDDGEYDFSPIVDSVRSRGNYIQHVLRVYEERKLPLQMVADSIGENLVKVYLDWPYEVYDYHVCSGVHEEREFVKNAILKKNKRFVLDVTVLLELGRYKLLQECLHIIGRPLVSASLKSLLTSVYQSYKIHEPSAIATENNGQLRFYELPGNVRKDRKKLLKDILVFIEECCETVPVIGPQSISKRNASVSEALGNPSHDIIYLALERNAILISEDKGLRDVASEMGVEVCAWIQPLLMMLRDNNIITRNRYSNIILDKIKIKHNFISVSADDLVWAAKERQNEISPIVRVAVETFRGKQIDLESGIVVGSQFLHAAVHLVEPRILYKYYRLILNELTFDREDREQVINKRLLGYIIDSVISMQSKKANKIKRIFSGEIEKLQKSYLSLKPLVRAMREELD